MLALQIELQIENELNEWVEQQVVERADGRSVLTLLSVLHLPSAWCGLHYGLRVRHGEPGCHVLFLVQLGVVCRTYAMKDVESVPSCLCSWGSKLSTKKFQAKDHVLKHIKGKHSAKLAGARQQVS